MGLDFVGGKKRGCSVATKTLIRESLTMESHRVLSSSWQGRRLKANNECATVSPRGSFLLEIPDSQRAQSGALASRIASEAERTPRGLLQTDCGRLAD